MWGGGGPGIMWWGGGIPITGVGIMDPGPPGVPGVGGMPLFAALWDPIKHDIYKSQINIDDGRGNSKTSLKGLPVAIRLSQSISVNC